MDNLHPNLIDPAVINAMQEQLREIRAMLNPPKSILNLSEAASFTGFSRSHLYKLTSTGGIPCYKRGKHLYFKPDELEQWMLSNRRATAEEIDAFASNYVVTGKGGAK
jgi:excisionase family DNA binding protein